MGEGNSLTRGANDFRLCGRAVATAGRVEGGGSARGVAANDLVNGLREQEIRRGVAIRFHFANERFRFRPNLGPIGVAELGQSAG